MIRTFSILALIFGIAISSYTCLCSHEKPVRVSEPSQSCHGHSDEAQTKNSVPVSDGCCCMDKYNIRKTQEAFVFNSANAVGTEQFVPISFESFQPVIVTFKLTQNFHPPSSKLPIYFTKHSFLI